MDGNPRIREVRRRALTVCTPLYARVACGGPPRVLRAYVRVYVSSSVCARCEHHSVDGGCVTALHINCRRRRSFDSSDFRHARSSCAALVHEKSSHTYHLL